MDTWETTNAASIVNRWQVLEPKSTSATNNAVLTKEADGSIVASGPNGNGVVMVVADTELTGITGFRLEVLTDSRLPKKGPGRADDGNFVLTEIELTAGPAADPKQAKSIKLVKALADFSQDQFSVTRTIDGDTKNNEKGWAVGPATGVLHWAAYETSEPIGTGKTTLTFKLHHKYKRTSTLGRFRLSVTRGAKPFGLSVPEDFRAILATAPEVRTEVQKNLLFDYFRAIDEEEQTKIDAVNASKVPPIDIKLGELREQVAFVRQPVRPDPVLAVLRHDLEMSVQQAAGRRLTATQDIAWALINSPAFLFNH
jgi:hypothetical protein